MINIPKILEKNTLLGLVIHLVLAFLSLISNVFVIGFVYLVLIQFVREYYLSSSNYQKNLVLFKLSLYLGSFEIICRILKCNPFVPYEFSKYLFTVVLLVVSFNGRPLKSSILPLIILILSFIFSFLLKDIAPDSTSLRFNFLGPVCVALFLFVFNKFKVSGFWPLLNAILYPIIVVWVYCYFYTPDFESLSITRNAVETTTGGFGTNQVSTALGLATFLMFIFIFKRRCFSGYFYLDIFIFFGIIFQGLLSFSRGGVLGGLLAVLIFILGYIITNPNIFKIGLSTLILLLFTGAFLFVNKITSGMILDRYLGKTEGVILGSKERDLNSFTTGRYSIFEEDMVLWGNNFFTGVGVGNSENLHSNGELAHSEFSRLLSEQGLFGGLFFLAWLIFCWTSFRNQPTMFGKFFVLSCTTLAFFTSFHAAMRTFITPVLTGLSVLLYTKEN